MKPNLTQESPSCLVGRYLIALAPIPENLAKWSFKSSSQLGKSLAHEMIFIQLIEGFNLGQLMPVRERKGSAEGALEHRSLAFVLNGSVERMATSETTTSNHGEPSLANWAGGSIGLLCVVLRHLCSWLICNSVSSFHLQLGLNQMKETML